MLAPSVQQAIWHTPISSLNTFQPSVLRNLPDDLRRRVEVLMQIDIALSQGFDPQALKGRDTDSVFLGTVLVDCAQRALRPTTPAQTQSAFPHSITRCIMNSGLEGGSLETVYSGGSFRIIQLCCRAFLGCTYQLSADVISFSGGHPSQMCCKWEVSGNDITCWKNEEGSSSAKELAPAQMSMALLTFGSR